MPRLPALPTCAWVTGPALACLVRGQGPGQPPWCASHRHSSQARCTDGLWEVSLAGLGTWEQTAGASRPGCPQLTSPLSCAPPGEPQQEARLTSPLPGGQGGAGAGPTPARVATVPHPPQLALCPLDHVRRSALALGLSTARSTPQARPGWPSPGEPESCIPAAQAQLLPPSMALGPGRAARGCPVPGEAASCADSIPTLCGPRASGPHPPTAVAHPRASTCGPAPQSWVSAAST